MLMLDDALAQVKLTSMSTPCSSPSCRAIGRSSSPISMMKAIAPTSRSIFHRLCRRCARRRRLVRARGGHFMDKPDNVLSLINLATVKSLGEQWGHDINPLRFRANFYIDGASPGRSSTGSGPICASATRLPGRPAQRPLRRHQRQSRHRPSRSRHSGLAARRLRPQGSRRLSLDARIRNGRGRRCRRSAAHRRRHAGADHSRGRPADVGHRRFICRGCYFIYEEAQGLPQQSIRPGTAFADIPSAGAAPTAAPTRAPSAPIFPPDRDGAIKETITEARQLEEGITHCASRFRSPEEAPSSLSEDRRGHDREFQGKHGAPP